MRVIRPLYQRFPMLGPSQAQVWTYCPRYRRPRHFHAEPELNLVVSGEATFGVGDAVIRVRTGDLLGFPPGQDHALLGASQDLVLFAIGMAPALSSEVVRGDPHAISAPLRVRLRPDAFEMLTKKAATLANSAVSGAKIVELWAQARAHARADAPSSGTNVHVATRRALGAIGASPELDRRELGRVTRTCPEEVGRYFRRDVGMTLVHFRTRIRLLRFIEFVDGKANLAAAALRAGFGSYSQCHRSFHATFGCTPKRFFLGGARRQMEETFEPLIQECAGA